MASKRNFKVNEKNYFRLRKTIGYKEKDGKRIPIEKAFYGISKRDAEAQYLEWIESQKAEKEKRSLITIGELADFYCDNVLSVSSKYASSTIRRYIGVYETHVKGNSLCQIVAKDLKPLDVQLFYNSLACTQATIKSINKFLAAFFKWANLNEYVSYPLSGVEIPKKQSEVEKEITVWTNDELSTITSNLGDYRLRFFVILSASTGLRIGELFGLKYVDFRGETLHVERQCHEGEISAPKANSVRQMPITDTVRIELERHRKWHEREMKRNNYKTEYVFTTREGKLLEYGNTRRSLTRYYNRIGITPKKFHAYRATFCTNLCRAGVPIQVASKLLGHKSIEVTMKYYTDVDQVEKRSALEMLPALNLS